MLKILENASPDIIYAMLFDLLSEHRRKSAYSKFIGLIVKCILKLTKVLETILPMVKLENLMLKFHEYLTSFTNEKYRNDDIGVKTIKTILSELIKLRGNQILLVYQAVIANHEKPDTCLQRYNTIGYLHSCLVYQKYFLNDSYSKIRKFFFPKIF